MFPLWSIETPPPSDLVRRIEAHLLLKDHAAACDECNNALLFYPSSSDILEACVIVNASVGNESAMVDAWERYQESVSDKSLNRNLVELMAWGILDKASRSSSVVTRAIALLASCFSQGNKGVTILHKHLSDNSSLIRALAVKLSGKMRDAKLMDEMQRLFREERSWVVRKEVIAAVGQMKIHSLEKELESIVAADHSTADEKALAIKAIVNMREDMDRGEMLRLVNSDRLGFRLLACEAIAHIQLERDRDLLEILSKDFHPKVRVAALQTLGLLRPWHKIKDIALNSIGDANPNVAITAGWLLTLEDPIAGQQVLEKYIMHQREELRLLAAAALSATGKYGVPLAQKQMRTSSDPYVKMNLAMGLVGQRVDLDACGMVLNQGLALDKDRWSWQEKGIFRILSPKAAKASDDEESSPETEDQLARLEILNMLAVMKDPSAQAAIKRFIIERSSSVSGTASALLLTEGDEEAVDIVKQLLKEPNPRIRIRAALLLSLWSRDEAAIKTLQEGYAGADHEMKSHIIEGVGRIGSIHSVPFLIEVLREPSQTLRVVAAMALIQCLNH